MFRYFSAVTLFCLSTLSAQAAPVAFDETWKTQRFSLFSSNTYGFNGASVTLVSNGSVSLAYRPLPESYWEASNAAWSWRVDEGVPATDLRVKGGDDRNLALYFVFLPPDEAQAQKGTSIRSLLTNESARVLVYVWGGAHARGDVLDSPYLGERGKTIVLRGSGTGSETERVNFARDYVDAFGDADTALVGLALSGDSDDTDTRIRAALGNLTIN